MPVDEEGDEDSVVLDDVWTSDVDFAEEWEPSDWGR